MQSKPKPLNVMIIEEDHMLSSSMKNMLKKMGFEDSRIHKAPNLAVFRTLVSKYTFYLIVCRYSIKDKPIGRKYLYLYRECERFSYDCSFVFLSDKATGGSRREIEELFPDSILEIPFNYNEFKPLINESLMKRKILSAVYREIDKGHFKRAIEICEQLSKKNNIWWIDLYKVIIECYISQKKYKLAIKTLNDLRTKDTSEWPLIKLIELNSVLGNEEEVLALAHEFEVLGYPEHPIVSEVTAHQSILDSDIKKALELIKKIVLRYPHLIDATVNLAYLYIAFDDYRKAYAFMSKVDYDLILNEQQFFAVEEVKTFLEIMLDSKRGNPYDSRALGPKLTKIMNLDGKQVDDLKLTKRLYQIVRDITTRNPVCAAKRIQEMYSKTQLPHRKLLLMAVAYHLGFTDELTGWLDSETERLSEVRHINAAVTITLCRKLYELKDQKLEKIGKATELEEQGRVLESLAILSKEIPSLITHHSNFVNAMIKYKLSIDDDINMLTSQFKSSIAVVFKNLQRQDPNHPKLTNIKKVQGMVLSKLEIEKRKAQSQQRARG
ncbi:hypothetical protein [Vibrio quintilis]|uniref:Response regulatory domain-containing protein n=1 Tax=Vibrio quintilis TaxID=1117707 RepID=A0A1M7Z2B4_9VIBR|nr:hypothetical protein [Vibrio quintilis]SHO59021.1 hypothetical protein VQ7734_04797 [Vibrio quintilis]